MNKLTKEKIKEIFILKYKTIISTAFVFAIVLILFIVAVNSALNTFEKEETEELYSGIFNSSGEIGVVGVHIKGEVKNPGYYEFETGKRVTDAIIAAGGFTENADEESVNLAARLEDEQQIVVRSKAETAAYEAGDNTPGKININTASVHELTTLDGIGKAYAEKIVNYRDENNGFSTIEQLMNISGISKDKFDKIKDYITV